ncbi:helix-turn-helix domain-containing protein [Patescibacteria group bacterium]|nr:helix-turn-helix domain-containing protein [Patescibacteria group bacterium]
MKKHKIAKEVKDQIIDRIKNQGISVSQAAKEHGISTNTIYTWLSRKTEGSPGLLEIAKLRKENHALKELIGEITLQMSRSQKKI